MASSPPAGAANQQQNSKAAGDRPVGDSTVRFQDAALKLLDNGYEPLPIWPRQKRPALDAWSSAPVDTTSVEQWARRFPRYGVGLRTGGLVGVDLVL